MSMKKCVAVLAIIILIFLTNGAFAQPSPPGPGGSQEAAREYQQQEDFWRGQNQCDQSTTHPTGPSAEEEWYNKGIDLDAQGKYDEAIQDFDNAIDINPQYADAWANKGWALNNLGKYSEAIKAYDKAIELNPQDANSWNNKGWAFNNLGNFAETIIVCEKAIELNPQLAEAWSNIGNALLNQNKYDDAIRAYDNATDINPQYAKVLYNKGVALQKLGRNSEAQAAYDRAKELGYSGGSALRQGTTTISPNASGITTLDHSMASDVDESTNRVITRTDEFSVYDSKAYSWLGLGNVGPGTVDWYWYSPDGNLYKTGSNDIPMPTSGDYWSTYYVWRYINIAGSNAVYYPGNWHVDVYMNGLKFLTEKFYINGGQPGTAAYWSNQSELV
jgi:tetratricopeptide (TPR) repeat protein